MWIQNEHDEDGDEDEDWEDCIRYFPEGAYDMGWLGYFVGKNDHFEQLVIRPFTPTSGSSVRDVFGPFFRGVCNNKSIQTISFSGVDLLGGEVFTMLGSFFKNNHNLINIHIDECAFRDEGVRLFALAIGSITHRSLKEVDLRHSNIDEEGMVEIITALSTHPYLQHLHLTGNRLHKNGCVALATLLRCSAKELQYLYLSTTEVNDEGIEALVPALANCSNLKHLRINNNPSITTRGWQRFAAILESPSCNLTSLHVVQNNVDDEAADVFANALANNHTLEEMNLWGNPSITAVGQQAFSKVLCNTSSINTTFLSNHTLRYLGGDGLNENAIIGSLLELNRRDDKEEVAMIKILQYHNDFDMLPLFEWEFKVLPLVLSWLERVSEYDMPEDFEPNIEERKLSTIYQFVRGMPVLYVETRLRKELEDIKAREKQMEEEQMRLQQELQMLQKRKGSIMKKLGGNVLTNMRK